MRPVPLCLSLAVLAGVWLGPLPQWAQHWFVAHMTMHVAVVAVAAPLLAWAVAGRVAFTLRGGGAGRWNLGAVALIASLAELAVVWGWHAPALHDLARGHGGWMTLEQGMFFASALVVWGAALVDAQMWPQAGEERDGGGLSGIVALMMTSMHMTFLGALLALGPHDLYGGHGAGHPDWDQQAGGLIMLLVGGTAYLVGGLGLLARLLRTTENVVNAPVANSNALRDGAVITSKDK